MDGVRMALKRNRHPSTLKAGGIAPAGPRVVLVSPGWPPARYPSGIATYTGQMVAALRHSGAEPFVVALDVPPGPRESWVADASGGLREPGGVQGLFSKVLDHVRPGLWKHRAIVRAISAQVRAINRSIGLELLEMEESFGWAAGVAGRTGLPLVVRLHGPWFQVGPVDNAWGPEFGWRVREEGRAIRSACAVSSPSRDILDRVRRQYDIDLPTARVIPCPVEPVPRSERWDRGAAHPRTVLFVGRFDSVKGGDLMIQAHARILREIPDAVLLLAGPGLHVRGEVEGEWLNVDQYASRVLGAGSAREQFRFLGPQSPEQLRALRREAAVVVACSRYETFGYTLAEAMSQGCPVVATDVGGMSEQIRHERNGLLARPNDAVDIAAQVLRLLREPRLGEALGLQATADCGARCAPDVVASNTLELYEQVRRPSSAAGQNAGPRLIAGAPR